MCLVTLPSRYTYILRFLAEANDTIASSPTAVSSFQTHPTECATSTELVRHLPSPVRSYYAAILHLQIHRGTISLAILCQLCIDWYRTYSRLLSSPCSCKNAARSFVHQVEQIDGLCRPSVLDTVGFWRCIWDYKPHDDTQMNLSQISRRILNSCLVKSKFLGYLRMLHLL